MRKAAGMIYMVESSPEGRAQLQRWLEQAALPVRVFGDGLEAYQACQASPPELLIADELAATLGGAVMARLLKNQLDLPQTTILLISATPDRGEAVCGADGVLTRPLDERLFLAEVQRLVKGD